MSESLGEILWSLALGQHACVIGAERDLFLEGGRLAEPADAIEARLRGKPFWFPRVLRWSASRTPAGAPTNATSDEIAGWLFDEVQRSDQDIGVIIEAADLVCLQLEHNGTDTIRRLLSLPVVRPDSPVRRFVVMLSDDRDGLPTRFAGDARVRQIISRPPGTLTRDGILQALTSTMYRWASGEPHNELVRLTDGMRAADLRALAQLSGSQLMEASQPRRVVARFRAGLDNDPWESLDEERVDEIETLLRERVIGQDPAIDNVIARLRTARVGLQLQTRSLGSTRKPRIVMFLVGPTGVGKTEFVRALASGVFGDESSIVRLDMGEFGSPASLERLGGAPPGYVGYRDETFADRVAARPFSVVLFDEIEKADAGVWDRLLAIIDDGRLTTGRGETVSFGDTIVCFTSNIGSKHIAESGAPSTRAETVEQLTEAVEAELTTKQSRPEVWGRLRESIIVFDALRQPCLPELVGKLVATLRDDAAERFELTIDIDEQLLVDVIAASLHEREGRWNGRTVRDELTRVVLNPLSDMLTKEDLPRNRRAIVTPTTAGSDCRLAET